MIFTQVRVFRCKLMYKDDSAYKERGIGMLHLKAVDGDIHKLQLLVRADTATGTCAYTVTSGANEIQVNYCSTLS